MSTCYSRIMKRAKIAILGVVTLLIMIAIAVVVVLLAGKALGTPTQHDATACADTGTEYIVTIKNSQLSINDIHARRCDKLTVVNDDNTLRLMAFGRHDHHQSYDGVTEKVLAQNQSFTVTLDQTGSFTFHDHLHDEVQGTFTVQ